MSLWQLIHMPKLIKSSYSFAHIALARESKGSK